MDKIYCEERTAHNIKLARQLDNKERNHMTTLDKIQRIKLGHRLPVIANHFQIKRVGTREDTGEALVRFLRFDSGVQAWVEAEEFNGTMGAEQAAAYVDCAEDALDGQAAMQKQSL